MFTPDAATQLISTYGLWILAPAAVLEGPIVTVVAAWLAQIGLLDLRAVLIMVVVADLIGDVLLYALGRGLLPALPDRLRARLGLGQARLERLATHFSNHGASSLILGKLTHTAGAVVLVAAGMARMRFVPFLLWNTAATLPKSLVFAALGWSLGDAHARIEDWIANASLLLVLAIVPVGLVWLWRRRVVS